MKDSADNERMSVGLTGRFGSGFILCPLDHDRLPGFCFVAIFKVESKDLERELELDHDRLYVYMHIYI